MTTLWFLVAFTIQPPHPGLSMPRLQIEWASYAGSKKSCDDMKAGKGMFKLMPPTGGTLVCVGVKQP